MDPIRCWWRSSAGAVRIGETFSMALTCATLENDAVQVVPDETRLGPSVMTLAPFEVVGGSHPADIRSGGRRFFQYHYEVRIINRDAIGTDVTLPLLEIHYRVNSRIAGNAALEGRDLTYLLPPQQVRILSIVPQDAADIRDVPGATNADFASVETLGFRANLFRILAIIFMAIGALMAVGAAVRLLLRARRRVPSHERRLSSSATLRLAARALSAAVRDSEAQGWSEPIADRAVSAIRVGAAVALGRRVNQRVVDETRQQTGRPFESAEAPSGRTEEFAVAEGRLLARQGRRSTMVSSPVTCEDVAVALKRLSSAAAPQYRQVLEDLYAGLSAFTAVLYGRPASDPSKPAALPDRAALDEAAARAATALQRLAAEQRSPAQLYRRYVARTPQLEGRA